MPRFTIRDLLWLTVVAALAISWWIDNKRIEKAIVKSQSEEARWFELNQQQEDAITILNNWNKKYGSPPSGHWSALQRAVKARDAMEAEERERTSAGLPD